MAKGESVRKAIAIRKAPNSSEEKTTKPLFIRIKDVPQIRASIIIRNQASGGVDSVAASGLFFVAVLIEVGVRSLYL
jgi:hypothetical protein